METETKRQNLTKCKNTLCALYNPDKELNCSANELGMDKHDIRSCNLRELFYTFVKREITREWVSKKREQWNLYQKAYRNRKVKEVDHV